MEFPQLLETLFTVYQQKVEQNRSTAGPGRDCQLLSREELSDLVEDKYTLKLDVAERNSQKVIQIEDYLEEAGATFIEYENKFPQRFSQTAWLTIGSFIGYVFSPNILVGGLVLATTYHLGKKYLYQRSQEKIIEKYVQKLNSPTTLKPDFEKS